jgi:hypothetical protein
MQKIKNTYPFDKISEIGVLIKNTNPKKHLCPNAIADA